MHQKQQKCVHVAHQASYVRNKPEHLSRELGEMAAASLFTMKVHLEIRTITMKWAQDIWKIWDRWTQQSLDARHLDSVCHFGIVLGNELSASIAHWGTKDRHEDFDSLGNIFNT